MEFSNSFIWLQSARTMLSVMGGVARAPVGGHELTRLSDSLLLTPSQEDTHYTKGAPLTP